MTAKQYLRQLATVEENIRELTEELEERRSRLTSTAAPVLGDKVQTSSNGDTFAAAMAILADKDRQRQELIFVYETLRDKIVDQILGLEDEPQKRVLYERYVRRKSWDTIAEDLNYTPRRIFQIHGNALIVFYNKYLSDK